MHSFNYVSSHNSYSGISWTENMVQKDKSKILEELIYLFKYNHQVDAKKM